MFYVISSQTELITQFHCECSEAKCSPLPFRRVAIARAGIASLRDAPLVMTVNVFVRLLVMFYFLPYLSDFDYPGLPAAPVAPVGPVIIPESITRVCSVGIAVR